MKAANCPTAPAVKGNTTLNPPVSWQLPQKNQVLPDDEDSDNEFKDEW